MQWPSRRQLLHAALTPKRDPFARLVDQDSGVDVCRSRGPHLREGDSPFPSYLLLDLAASFIGKGLVGKVIATDAVRGHPHSLQNHVGIERMIENLDWNGATGWEVSVLFLNGCFRHYRAQVFR